MSLALITQPAFLHAHFPYTRKGLLGQWPKSKAKSRISGVLPEIETISAPSAVIAESFPQLPVVTFNQQPESWTQPQPIADTVPQVTQENNLIKVTSKTDVVSKDSLLKSITRFVLTVIMVVSLSVGAILIVPEVYYTVFSRDTAVGKIADEAKLQVSSQPMVTPDPEPYMPPQNPDLPTGTWISIPRIGVYSEMHATLDENEALNKGVWLVPDFGRPGDTTQPVIAAAHRFGWDWWWKSDYWKYNSFYLLTETEPGDRIEVIYDQRKWVYEIYAGEEGELISDYDADLILYTCKYLNSPIRYFRYAKLITE